MYNIAFTGMVIVAIFNLVDLEQTSQNVLQAVGVFWGSFFCSFAFVLPRLLESRRDRRVIGAVGDTSNQASSYHGSDMTKRVMRKNIDDNCDSHGLAQQPVAPDGSMRSKVPTLSSHQHPRDLTVYNDSNKSKKIESSSSLPEESSSALSSNMDKTRVANEFPLIHPSPIWETVFDDNDNNNNNVNDDDIKVDETKHIGKVTVMLQKIIMGIE
jgi:hypothetical protein